MVIENLYCMVLSNFGFTGQDVGLSIEAALRLLEFFIFECDSDYEHFIALITYMLLLCQDEVLKMSVNDMLRYTSQGGFIQDCLTKPEIYSQLYNDYLLQDQILMHEEDAMPLDREFSQLAANQNNCPLFGHHQSMELSNLDEIRMLNKEISNETKTNLRGTEPFVVLGMADDEEVKANFNETFEDWDR